MSKGEDTFVCEGEGQNESEGEKGETQDGTEEVGVLAFAIWMEWEIHSRGAVIILVCFSW
jgi:hypothetical protein